MEILGYLKTLLGSPLFINYLEELQLIGGMQVGGGVNLENSLRYLEEGASHVIITSVRTFFG